jgi:hypothetical protein
MPAWTTRHLLSSGQKLAAAPGGTLKIADQISSTAGSRRIRLARSACLAFADTLFDEAIFRSAGKRFAFLLTAAVSQHFLIALVLAAPASGLPSLLTALVAHDCAAADPIAKDITSSARARRFIAFPPL